MTVVKNFAHDNNTLCGLCHYFYVTNNNQYQRIAKSLKLKENKWMFTHEGINTVFQVFEFNLSIDIAIGICQQRIDYLKKFLSNGQE